MIDKDQLIIIGKITKPVGLKGELKVLPITDFPQRFVKMKKVYILDSGEKELLYDKNTDSYEFRILKVTGTDAFIRILFENYDNVDKVSFFKNCFLCVQEKDRVKIPKNVFYFYDLAGCEVYNRNELIGKVVKIENYGSSDLFSVITENGNNILIPFLKEFVKSVDIKNKRINVDLIEGFI